MSFAGGAIQSVLFLNSIVLTFTDIQFGRTALLGIALCANVILFSFQDKFKAPKYSYLGFILVSYLCIRQTILLMNDVSIYSETTSAIMFILYTISFALFINMISPVDVIVIIARYFLYFNLVFGIPDYFGIDLSLLHVETNDILRFRGLATEPNLLAMPLLIIFFGLLNSNEKYVFKRVDIAICLLMIYFSYSKAAYLGFVLIWVQPFYSKAITFRNFLKIISVLGVCLVVFNITNAADYLYKIPFYNNFISLIDFDLIASFGLNEYITSLSALDQFQSGSLGTRLATAVASVHTIFLSPFTFLFGVGGGDSYPYLIKYIFDNRLDNYELNMHLSYNPEFITDKTYVLKFITEYGFVGFALLASFLIKATRAINESIKAGAIRILFYLVLCMLLNQSTFIFCYILVAIKIYRLNQLPKDRKIINNVPNNRLMRVI